MPPVSRHFDVDILLLVTHACMVNTAISTLDIHHNSIAGYTRCDVFGVVRLSFVFQEWTGQRARERTTHSARTMLDVEHYLRVGGTRTVAFRRQHHHHYDCKGR